MEGSVYQYYANVRTEPVECLYSQHPFWKPATKHTCCTFCCSRHLTLLETKHMMSQKYQTEQQELTEKIESLSAELESEKQTTVDAETWISLIKKYANPTELTAELPNTLIDKIVIHEATTDEDGLREQDIDIYYRFIGKIE